MTTETPKPPVRSARLADMLKSDDPLAVAKAQAKINPRPPLSQDVKRVSMITLESMGLWLIERLRERYTHVDDRNCIGWLRGLMGTNDKLFVHTANAVGLAQVVHRPLRAEPYLEEVFVFYRDNAVEEAAMLYDEFFRWGESMGASEIAVGIFSDVPMELIRTRIGPVRVRQVHYSPICAD